MKLIKKGDRGTEVEVLQHLLSLSDFQIEVDGDFGRKTDQAVRGFQAARFDEKGKSLFIDGKVGDSTWWALFNYDKFARPAIVEVDPFTIRKINRIHPELREELNEAYRQIRERGVSIRITDSLRTMERQADLYAQGRTTPGPIVTNAKPGQSYHNFGLAIDFALLLPENRRVSWNMDLDLNDNQKKDWNEVVAVFKHFGWEWGGNWVNFKDYPHFEKTFGYSTSELLSKYRNNERNGKYVHL